MRLGHPTILKEIVQNKRGLVLVTGPTGSGKEYYISSYDK